MTVLEDLIESFRNIIPYYFVLIVPLLILISPIDPVKAAQQFTAYRLQQYDLTGMKLGSRSSAFNFEAQTSYSKLISRKCLLLKIMEVSAASIKLAISQNVGSIIILLPSKSQWDSSLKEHILNLEKELLIDEFSIPIYFTFETEEVENIYNNVQHLMETSKSSSAAQALISSVMSNGYQLYTSYQKNSAINDFQITNFYGKLAGHGIEEQLPTLLLVAHYDSMGMAPSLSYGYDSNGSGVVVMFQLMRLFSRLYANPKSQAKYNIAFLLSGGGKLNYIGTKKWLEELHELQDESLTPERVSMAVCFERLGLIDDGLNLHVSKPPKEGSVGHRLVDALQYSMKLFNSSATMVHKRINLNEDELQWEHERFSLKKMPALTLSSEKDRVNNRRSILDDEISIDILTRNTRAIVDSLMKLLYGLEDGHGSVIEDHWVSQEAVEADVMLLTRFPRSQQLIDHKHPLLVSFEKIFKRFLQNVRKSKIKADPRDPEFVLYADTDVTIIAHKVKPALFDFMVACVIIAYLGLVYLFIENFSTISRLVLKVSTTQDKHKEKHS